VSIACVRFFYFALVYMKNECLDIGCILVNITNSWLYFIWVYWELRIIYVTTSLFSLVGFDLVGGPNTGLLLTSFVGFDYC